MRDPLFVIAPPRSYTSVVGGIMGQHPEAYGLPEVNLSHGDTLGQCWDSVFAVANFSTSGILRLLAELHEGEQTEEAVLRARQWVLHRLHWPIERVWAHIGECVPEGRMIVEKSPRNTAQPENLRRLLAIFPNASFLHLTRHPGTQGRSVIELMKSYGEERMVADPQRIWLRMQSNIMEFSKLVPPGSYLRVKGEELMGDLPTYLPQICEWLGLDASEEAVSAMLHPETSPYASLGPPSAPFGNDPNFLTSPELDMERLAAIREPALSTGRSWELGEAFSEPVTRLARDFGYA